MKATATPTVDQADLTAATVDLPPYDLVIVAVPTALEDAESRALYFENLTIVLQAKIAADDADKAAALAHDSDRNNPYRNYQIIPAAIALVRVDGQKIKSDVYKKVQKLCAAERLYSYVYDDTGHRKVCANDLDDFFNKRGRHGW
jgi:hypothetical protein